MVSRFEVISPVLLARLTALSHGIEIVEAGDSPAGRQVTLFPYRFTIFIPPSE